ncbi:hypothetical protein [Puia dinghuensis]|uniref:Uncharacterized protein n=1 Tax=Puia dinghuensis TaxID=1792502 RepID=A0A8J2UIK1_9BACT|nr:hypothetical protein [Puia dinghuensis]GGB22499.1 hypothetical protein GCM10011511_53030 [Puia dinghuensis]
MRKPIPLLLLSTALSCAAAAQSSSNAVTIDNAISDLSAQQIGNGNARAVGSFVNFHAPKENTKGRRMLLTDWAKGYVVTSQDSVLQNDRLVFNYDKMSHDLYYSFDRQTVIEAERSHVKGFHLVTPMEEMDYGRFDLIKPEVFFRILTHFDAAHYGLYSLTTTEFKKSDYHTDGLVESGNNYDEYVDKIQYYIVSPGGKAYQPVELKKKNIRSALPSAKTKVEEYLSQHKDDDVNEIFLKNLIDYINKG